MKGSLMTISASKSPLRVAIVGAGYSGIAAAVRIKLAGFQDVTVFEKSDNVGGTWWDNRYPGAEVDTPSIIYSFSYHPSVWSRTHVRQSELLSYLEEVVQEFGLTENIRLGAEVRRAVWRADQRRWAIEFADGSSRSFDILISAVGFLSVPKRPTWPGLDRFAGEILHSARWDSRVCLAGKSIASVGTGSTAAQLVPVLASLAGHLTVFQREPGWILPKAAREFSPSERAAMESIAAQRINRLGMLMRREKAQYRNAALRPGAKANAAAEANARKYIASVFASRPDLAEAVTPSYPYGGKRPILADDFYPALLRENVTLVPAAVSAVDESGVFDSDGRHHAVDVLVLSTGFVTEFVTTYDVVGPAGSTLLDTWKGEPTSLAGIMTPGFPNFFMMYGPNTNGGSILTHFEAQAHFIAKTLRVMCRRRADLVEARPRAVKRFEQFVQHRLRGTSFYETRNYYTSPSGRVVTQWSDGPIVYTLVSRAARLLGVRTTRAASSDRRRALAGVPRRTATPRAFRVTDLLRFRSVLRDVKVLRNADSGSMFAPSRMVAAEDAPAAVVVAAGAALDVCTNELLAGDELTLRR